MLANELLSDWPPERWRDRRLVLGVSGGADSVAMLLAFHELAAPHQIVVAHLNHGWRGEESDTDAAFVVNLCNQLGHECTLELLQNRDSHPPSQSDFAVRCEPAMLSKHIEPAAVFIEEPLRRDRAAATDNQTEEKARMARYDFFKEVAYKYGASYVVTAHTADDRVETLLHNMLRGTGLAGAASLVMSRPFDEDLVLVRPLLRKRRPEIEAFLTERAQNYRQDSSNLLTHYRRNFLRRELLPLATGHYPAAATSLLSFSELAEELLADWEQLADRWLGDVQHSQSASSSSAFVVTRDLMQSTPWSVVQLALRRVWLQRGWPLADMSRSHWQALRRLASQASGVVNLPGNLRAEASQSTIRIVANLAGGG